MTDERLKRISTIVTIWIVVTATAIALSTAYASVITTGKVEWSQVADRFVWWLAWWIMIPLAGSVVRFVQSSATTAEASARGIILRAVGLFVIGEGVRMFCRIAVRAFFGSWPKAFAAVVAFRSIVVGDLVVAAVVIVSLVLIALQWRAALAEAESAALQERVAKARLAFLADQLKPHFLFNALNGVVALLEDDPQSAKALLHRLTRFIQWSFGRDLTLLTTVDQELETARAYAEIQLQRFDGLLAIRFDVQPDALSFCVPPFLLQPLVENAIQHGIAGRTPGEVTIRLRHKGGRVRLEVDDTGNGYPRNMIERVGISNTRDRLHALFPDATFSLGRSDSGGASVVVEFPARLESEVMTQVKTSEPWGRI
jgi:signal transduction histidine kinase